MTAGVCHKRGVFIVDDHPLVRESLTNLINQQTDLTVCGEAESARATMQGIAAARPDIAIVDISLKDSFGIELIKDLRNAHPDLHLLVFSMHDEALYAERVLRSGARGYIMKQEATGKVIEGIRQILDGRIYVSESIADAMALRFVEGKESRRRFLMEHFTDRELEAFEMLGHGFSVSRIAGTLGVSTKSVHGYCVQMTKKLKLTSRNELLREAFRWGENRHMAE